MADLLRCLLIKGHPRLFWICSNSKVWCLNLEADQLSLVLQVGYDLPVKTEHIVQPYGGLFLERILSLAQTNCRRRDGSIEPSIFGGVIKILMIHRIILDFGNYELSFSQISGVLENWGASKRKRIILWDVNWLFRKISKRSLNRSIDSNGLFRKWLSHL